MNDRKRLEAIVDVMQFYLKTDGVSAEDAISLILGLVDPLPEQPEQEPVATARLWDVREKKYAIYPLYTAPPSKQEQEPVAWVRDLTSPQPHCVTSLKYRSVADTDAGVKYIPVYVAPPSKQDVNQELVEALEECERYGGGYTNCEESYLPPTVRDKVRAALAKHKEKQNGTI